MNSHPALDRATIQNVAGQFSLPLRQGLRRTSGNVPSSNAGSSIDFQDHRPYVPGDDPRHIDWMAYARSGNYTMKLYREEVRPLVDLVIDHSGSVFFPEAKSLRSRELFFFSMESALRSGASLRAYTCSASNAGVVDASVPDLPPGEGGGIPALERVPWRPGSLRVLISDLLFPAEPAAILALLLTGGGRPLIFCPWEPAEETPDWLGNTELVDMETGTKSDHWFRGEDLRRYETAYRSHFDLWADAARGHGVPFARVSSDPELAAALAGPAMREGAVYLL